MALATLVAAPVAANAAPAHPVCDDYKSYKVTSHGVDNFVQTIPTVSLYNAGTTEATLSTNITITGTVSLAVTASITVEASVIVAGAKGTVGATATASLSAAYQTGASVKVLSHHTGYIKGGIFRGVTTGTYEHIDQICRVTKGTVTAKTPYKIGYIVSGG
jgi:hypothetical protein